MLAYCVTFLKGEKLPKKSLLNITSQFCRGYGVGYIATVLKSPIKEMIGKTIVVDSRTKDNKTFNQYPDKINRHQKMSVLYCDKLPNIETTLK